MENSHAPRRLEWVDAVRGFAVFLVVMHHAVIALPDTGASTPDWLERINDAVSPLRIPILMLLSGMLLSRSLEKPTRAYIVGKLSRIGWPYLVWTALTLAFLYVGSHAAGDGEFTIGRTLALIVDPRTYTWYLAYLLAYYLLALFIPARYRYALIPVLLIVSVLANGSVWSRATFLLAFFFLGDWFMQHRNRWHLVGRPWVLVGATLLALGTIVVAGAGVSTQHELWSVPGTVATFVCLMAASGWALRSAFGRFAARVGRVSIVYYVTHWPVVAATAHVLALTKLTNGAVAAGIMIAIALAVCAVMTWLRGRLRPVAFLYAWPQRRHVLQAA